MELSPDGSWVTLSLNASSSPAAGSITLITTTLLLNVSAVLFRAHVVSDINNHRGQDSFIKLGTTDFTSGGNFVEGQDVGFVQSLTGTQKTGRAELGIGGIHYHRNSSETILTLIVSALGLTAQQPIPGGCALQYPLAQVPVLDHQERFGGAYTALKWPLAAAPHSRSRPDLSCDTAKKLYGNRYQYEISGQFLPAVIDASSLKSALKDGTRGYPSCSHTGNSGNQLSIGLFAGQNAVVKLRVRDPVTGQSSDYVSVVIPSPDTYHNLTFTIVVCIVGIISGLFLTLFAQRFMYASQFLIGWIMTGFIGLYLMFHFNPDTLSYQEKIGTSLFGSLLGGIVCSVLWHWKRSPIIAFFFTSLVFGLFTSAIVSYSAFDSWSLLFGQPLPHYLTIAVVWLVTIILLLLVTIPFGHIIGSSGTGSSLFVWSLSVLLTDYDASLHYIIIRGVQRLIVPDLVGSTCYWLPFSMTDLILSIVWAVLLLVGALTQWLLVRKFPFRFPGAYVRDGRGHRPIRSRSLSIVQQQQQPSNAAPQQPSACMVSTTQPSAPLIPNDELLSNVHSAGQQTNPSAPNYGSIDT